MGTFLGVPIVRDYSILVYWGLYWGLLILGNYHFDQEVLLPGSCIEHRQGLQNVGYGLA